MRKPLGFLLLSLALGGCASPRVGTVSGPTTYTYADIPCYGRVYYWAPNTNHPIPPARYADPMYFGEGVKPEKLRPPTKLQCTPLPRNYR